MKTRGAIGFFIACALALAMFAAGARADERNQATQLTFDQAVRIPGGTVLPPGTYWFKVGDSPTDQNVVQVFDADWSVIATTLAIPTERPEATDKTMLKMAEGAPDDPLILVKWFYPGRTTGHEFLYSAPTESQISESNVITVMAAPAQNGTQIANAQY